MTGEQLATEVAKITHDELKIFIMQLNKGYGQYSPKFSNRKQLSKQVNSYL